MFVPELYRFTRQKLDEVMEFLKSEDDEVHDVPARILLAVDYIYNHENNNYDGGLSFLDRLHQKLWRFHLEWDIPLMKNHIVNANDPQKTYLDTITKMLSDPRDRLYYGF